MVDHLRPKLRKTLRRRLPAPRISPASCVALVAVVAALVALPAETATAIARDRGGGDSIRHGHGDSIDRGLGTGNSSAVAVNTTDHSLVFKLTFAILTVTGTVIDNLNLADAYASCNQCQTVAISIQTLLVDSAASTVAPINEASARNQNCQQCDTLALAYQFVVADGTNLEFTREGRREIEYLRRQLEMLRRDAIRTGMTGAQIASAVAVLMKQYAGILSTQLVPASQPVLWGDGTQTSAAPPAVSLNTSTTANPGVPSTTTTTAPSPSTGTSTAPSTARGTSTTTPGATTTSSGATTTTSSSTPTATTGTTPTSGQPTVTTTTTTGTPITTSGAATTPSGTTTTTSGSTTPTSP